MRLRLAELAPLFTQGYQTYCLNRCVVLMLRLDAQQQTPIVVYMLRCVNSSAFEGKCQMMTENTLSAYFHLRNINRLCPFLSTNNTEVLAHALVTTRIDNCNALYTGLPSKLLHKLHLVQNSAARVLSRTPSTEHISPVLQQLHWLPVKYRVEFKILLLTYKALHNLAPQYLNQLLHVYTPSRALRSSSSIYLVVPRIRLSTMGARYFRYAALRLWNSRPHDIRNSDCLLTFKTRLKTYVFIQAFL